MQLENAHSPRWSNAEHTAIDLVIKWDAIAEELPFTASPTDIEAHGRAIFEAAAAGDFGVVAAFVAPPAPPVILAPVTPRQIRMALTRAGLRTTVEAAVAAGDQDLKDWYEYSNEFNRDNPLVAQMATAIGQTPAQIDALWELAAGL
jgi:hypothetical protein